MRPSVLVAAFLAAAAPAQEPRPTFRADTALVRLDAQVADRRGAPIAGLTRDDFLVFENGKPQAVLHFGAEDERLDLLLLVDKSGSMYPAIGELAVSALDCLSVLRPGDRVGVMAFDRRAELLSPLTADMQPVATSLGYALNVGGGTDINRGVFDAARHLRDQPRSEARRSILILTDNRSFKSRNDRSVVRELWEADAVLNALIFETGGEWLRAGAPAESLRGMLDRIRKRYSLHYRPPAGPAGKARSIRVALSPGAAGKHPGATVRARRGYVPVEEVP